MIGLNSALGWGRFGRRCLSFPPLYARPPPPPCNFETNYKMAASEGGSALFNTCRKALGHLMKFTQCSIPYRLGLAG